MSAADGGMIFVGFAMLCLLEASIIERVSRLVSYYAPRHSYIWCNGWYVCRAYIRPDVLYRIETDKNRVHCLQRGNSRQLASLTSFFFFKGITSDVRRYVNTPRCYAEMMEISAHLDTMMSLLGVIDKI
ncbi:hypothetical protein BZA77DRAFT_319707 [Pyronema omphalodes]|nr:hypothetical protein BZA77DRAFT_319707 [Pyronema omphalodes]